MADTRTYTDQQLLAAIASSDSWRGTLRALGLLGTSAGARRSVQRHADRLGADYGHFRRGRRWTEDELREAVSESNSWSDVARKLRLNGGSSAALLKGHAARLALDSSHFGAGGVEAIPRELHPRLDYLAHAGGSLAAAWFKLCGHQVSWPLEPCRYDLLVAADDGFRRVQVKTTTRRERSTWVAQITTSDGKKTRYDPDDIDEFFIIDGDLNYYLIPVTAVGGLGSICVNAYQHYRLPKLPGMDAVA